MSPTPRHHTEVGHMPFYRHTYAQWLAFASGGTLEIEHWILWVGSQLSGINSIKPYTQRERRRQPMRGLAFVPGTLWNRPLGTFGKWHVAVLMCCPLGAQPMRTTRLEVCNPKYRFLLLQKADEVSCGAC